MIDTAARGHGPSSVRSLGRAGRGASSGKVGRGDNAPMDARRFRAPDRSRAIVVITADGELAVAVRDTVPSGIAVVRDARPDDAAEVAAAACLPWPWMVVGS